MKYSPTATDSNKIMIQSIVASIQGRNWLSIPLTGGQHLQKVLTVTPLKMCGQSMKAFLRNGVLGKKKLDPKRIVCIKEATFQTYPLETGETIVGAWAMCIKSIDESCRRLNRIPKGKEN